MYIVETLVKKKRYTSKEIPIPHSVFQEFKRKNRQVKEEFLQNTIYTINYTVTALLQKKYYSYKLGLQI